MNNKVRTGKAEATSYATDTQRIVKRLLQALYANERESLEKMGKFWETHNLPKRNQEEQKVWTDQITRNETESVILKKLPTNKDPRPDSFIGEFYPIDELKPLLKTFYKITEGRMFPNSFWDEHHADIKTRQRYTKKKITGPYQWWIQRQISSTKS